MQLSLKILERRKRQRTINSTKPFEISLIFLKPLKFFIRLISVPSIETTHIADITSRLNAAEPFKFEKKIVKQL